jgi:sialate O-acetylesterase
MFKHVTLSLLALLIAIVGFSSEVNAELRLPRVFSSHMVLQQDKPIVVWGWAQPNEEVSVEAGTSTGKATANDKGEWKLTLPALKAGGPAIAMKVSASNQITFDDVLVGEVWLCSGQSNMEFGIGNAINAKAEIAAADEPEIRLPLRC